MDKPEGEKKAVSEVARRSGIIFPPDLSVSYEARRLVADKNTRVEDLALCCAQDPVVVIDFLRIANAMYFSGGRPPITITKTAIIRLGSDVVLETLDELNDRPQIEDKGISEWFEIHRSRCKRSAIVARMLSEIVAKTISDECQTAGLLVNIGDMLAVMQFGAAYVRLATDQPRTSVNYRLQQDHKFDNERAGLNFLRRNGIPEALLIALDREASNKAPERAVMKPLVAAAAEMVDAFDSNRWDKIAPGKVLPSKSNIRLLQISESQYLKVYERASEYLFSIRLLEERKKQSGFQGPTVSDIPIVVRAAEQPRRTLSERDQGLQSEIQNLLGGLGFDDAQLEPAEDLTVDASLEEMFRLPNPAEAQLKPARVASIPGKTIEPPKLQSNKSTKIVTTIASMFDKANSSEELFRELLGMMIGPGLFEKCALVVVAQDRKSALVVASRGPSIESGQKIEITDPLNPLAECFQKVQSFGLKESKTSPFGSRAYAVSPVDADHGTPVALYADCGLDGTVSFEARRVFRSVVDILNEKLPQLPGGILNELPS